MKKVMELVWTIYGVVAVIAGIICIRDYRRAMRALDDDNDNDDETT